MRVLDGRFGPYVTDGTLNASVPRGIDPESLSLEQAVELLRERAARAPATKTAKKSSRAGKRPAKKSGTKKSAAKKAPAKKTSTKKAAAKKTVTKKMATKATKLPPGE